MKDVKMGTLETAGIIVGVILLVVKFFIPNAGRLALVDEAIKLCILWGILFYLVLKLINIRGGIRSKLGLCIVPLIIFLINVLGTSHLIKDLISGPQDIGLSNVKVYKSEKMGSFLSTEYYLEGYDEEGNKHRIEITKDHSKKVFVGDEAELKYFKNTGKLYRFYD